MTTTPQNATGTSVDAREVAYYDGLATTWWDEKGPFWPLHRLNQLRATWITHRLTQHFRRSADAAAPLSDLRVLDVGCGGGILSESLAARGAQVTGIDVVEKNIAIARAHAAKDHPSMEYHCTTAEELAATGATFDVVLNMEVVEHVADVNTFMRACATLTRPGGTMFVATLNRTAKSWLFGIVGAEYVMRWLPRGTHRWRWFRTPGEIDAHLQRSGLHVVERTGVHVSPFTRKFSLQQSLQVNYMLWAHKP